MGIYYDLYLEGRVKDTWRCLSPFLATPDGSFALAPLMSGKSSIGLMLDDVDCWHSCPNDLSKEVRRVLWKRQDEHGEKTDEIDDRCIEWFSLSDLTCDPARFEHEAYVPRESMNSFEIGEVDDIYWWLTPQEYGELPPEEKQGYTFYRWTEPYGIYDLKCRLKQLAEELRGMYCDTVLLYEKGYPKVSEMRIIVRFG